MIPEHEAKDGDGVFTHSRFDDEKCIFWANFSDLSRGNEVRCAI